MNPAVDEKGTNVDSLGPLGADGTVVGLLGVLLHEGLGRVGRNDLVAALNARRGHGAGPASAAPHPLCKIGQKRC